MKKDIEIVIKVVCEYFDINAIELFKKTRKREIINARMYYYYLSKKYTKLSLQAIGNMSLRYGRDKVLDHTTVLHGINVLEDLITTYKSFTEILIILKKNIESCDDTIIVEGVNLIEMCLDENVKQAS